MILGGENLSQIGAALAQSLFNGLWIGAIVALAVHLFVRLHGGLNAASRHAAWYAALVVIAATPAIGFAVSLAHIRVSVNRVITATSSDHVRVASGSIDPTSTAPALDARYAALPFFTTVIRSTNMARVEMGLATVLAGIASVRIALLCFGLFGLARVKRASRKVDPSVAPTLARTMARDRGARAVDVRVADILEAPAAAGFRTPAILLPQDLIELLEPAALDQIAMHEYAHLRRYDDWTNLAQRFVERIYWFNPAVWFVSGRIDLEREIACDDWAVAESEGVSGYADCLWRLASNGRQPSFAATAPGAFLTRNQITARIEHLLERRRDRSLSWRPSKLLAIAPVLAAALVLAINRAPAIALHVTAASSVDTRTMAASEDVRPRLMDVAMRIAAPTSIGVVSPNCPHRSKVRADVRPIRQAVRTALVREVIVRHFVVEHTMHLTEHVRTHELISAASAAYSSAVAAAGTTDNQSDGSITRNLLAHCTGCDLSDKDLRNADLHGLSLTGDDLSGADLRGANLRDAVLTGVDLSGAKLDGADLRGTVLTGSDIDGASFTGAKTDGIKLVGMQLTNAIVAGNSARAIIGACAGCDLSGLDLRGRDLHGITLDGADLQGADLSGANLSGARFNGVDLKDAKFDGADLTNAIMNGCNLQGVDLSHARIQGLVLQGSTLGIHSNPASQPASHAS